MSWLPKRNKLDPVQALEYPPAVLPSKSLEWYRFRRGAGGKKKVEKVGGGGDVVSGTGKKDDAAE